MEHLLMAGINAGAGGSDGMRSRNNTYTSSTNFLSTSLPLGGKVSPVYRGNQNSNNDEVTNDDDEGNEVGMRSIFAKLLSLKEHSKKKRLREHQVKSLDTLKRETTISITRFTTKWINKIKDYETQLTSLEADIDAALKRDQSLDAERTKLIQQLKLSERNMVEFHSTYVNQQATDGPTHAGILTQQECEIATAKINEKMNEIKSLIQNIQKSTKHELENDIISDLLLMM